MSLEEKMNYKPYDFKFKENDLVSIKPIDEIKKIDETLRNESAESDWESYPWYLYNAEAEELQYKKLQVQMGISWQAGLPYYHLKNIHNGEVLKIAEFYLQEYVKIKPVSEGLILNEIFENIPEKDGVRIRLRVPIKIEAFDVAYEESDTWGSGIFRLIFLLADIENMSDDEIIALSRKTPLANRFSDISITREIDVVYASFGYHRISRIPGAKKF